MASVFTLVRQIVVNNIVEAKTAAVCAALVPGLVVSACVAACALPVRLLTGPGFGSMLMICAAGVVGGLIGLGLSRAAREELLGLVSKVRGH